VFIIDDVVTLGMRGILYIFREVQEAAAGEMRGEKETLRRELSELYVALEKKEVTEEEFAAREEQVLARLCERDKPTRETEEVLSGAGVGARE
jgi:hypothetical protein